MRIHLFTLSILLVIAATTYFETIRSMVDIYLRSATFVHGIIILPISLYLIWRRWPLLKTISPQMSFPGIFLLLVVSIFWLVSDILGIQVGRHFAVTAVIPAAVITIMGFSFARSIAFPLAYLFFAVPFGEFWVPVLQEITADLAVSFLRLTGIPVLRDGLFLVTPTGNFEVAEACSGIRYMLAALALGTIYAYLSYQRIYKRLIFIVFSLALPILANGVRAYGIIAIAHYSDMKYAIGVDHLIYGWIFFGAVIFLMFLIGNRYRDSDVLDHGSVSAATPEFGGAPGSWAVAFVVLAAAIAMAVGPVVSAVFASRYAEQSNLVNGLPVDVAGWHGSVLSEPQWQPAFVGATRESMVTYRRSNVQVDVALISYSGWRQGREVANSLNSVVGDDGWRELNTRRISVRLADGTSVELFEASAVKSGLVRLFWYWYDVDGDAVIGSLQTKLLEARSLATGGSGISSAIIISAVDDGRTRDTFHAFLVDTFDVIGACLSAESPRSDCKLGVPAVDSRIPEDALTK
jgi:exosortase A